MSLTQDLIGLIRSKPIDSDDLQQSALLMLDAVACAYAGTATPVGNILRQWAGAQARDDKRDALLMGALTHITETDDLHRASVTHPGCVVVPAVLALGERLGSSPEDILRAMAQGFEAMCRVGAAVGPAHYRVWHNTATCGPFGSAMACASLLGLDDRQTADALGNAGTHAGQHGRARDVGQPLGRQTRHAEQHPLGGREHDGQKQPAQGQQQHAVQPDRERRAGNAHPSPPRARGAA